MNVTGSLPWKDSGFRDLAEQDGPIGTGGGGEVAGLFLKAHPCEQGEGGGFNALNGPSELRGCLNGDAWVQLFEFGSDGVEQGGVRCAAAAEDDGVWCSGEVEPVQKPMI